MTRPALRDTLRGTPRVAAAIVLVFAGIWAGARIHSARMARSTAVTGIPVPAGEASAPNPSDLDSTDASPTPTQIPDRLPQFSLANAQGERTPIARWAGKSLMINFWATWCAPCRREIPLLRALRTEWSARGVEVVGIAVDHRENVLEFSRKYAIEYPILIGEQDALDAAAAFGMKTPVFPFTVFTDAQGQVVSLFVGELHRPQASLILSIIQDLDQGKIPLLAAKQAIARGLSELPTHPSG